MNNTNVRKTKLYKEMTSYLACAIAEGFCEGEGANRDDQITAWQYLVDTGQCWHLQGWYGRTATALIDQGIVLPAKTIKGIK
jgi:hypothetical protein